MKSILIVEDDESLRRELKEVLEESGYHVFEAGSGADGLLIIRTQKIDLCLLDVGLPDCFGTQLCQKIRGFSLVPIIFLTGCDDEAQIINAFHLGADDYVTKPFRLSILMSRITAQLRRSGWHESGEEEIHYASGDLYINPSLKQIKKKDDPLALGPLEYAILEILVRNYGRVVSRKMILESLWDNKNNFVENNTLSVNISRLRKKLGDYEGQAYIETVKKQGYFWSVHITNV